MNEGYLVAISDPPTGPLPQSTALTIDFPLRHSRLTTFFRFILAIPLFLFIYVYEIAAFVALIIAWFALVITGRYPDGLYRFVSGFLRYYIRVVAYILLAVDAYPPFDGGEHPEYPVHLTLAERKPQYSRLKVLLRVFYLLPMAILVYVLMIVLYVLVIIAWVAIVISGRLPGFIATYAQFALAWLLKFESLALLLTENY
jgi:hypothetical protein